MRVPRATTTAALIILAPLHRFAFYLVAVYPTEPFSWCDFFMFISFAVGSGVLVYTSYPENFNSTAVFDFLSCTKSKRGRELSP